ncbi:MAG: deoxyribonuclease IV [Chlorobiota bacterium]
MDRPLLLGVQVSIAGGLPKAARRAREIGCTAFQVFTANARQWSLSPLPPDTAAAFREALKATGIQAVVAHAAYLPNPASPQESLRRRSYAALEAECRRCQQLGIPLLVLHPGSCPAEERKAGIRRVARALAALVQNAGEVPQLCIELTAGQGNALGGSLEELAQILELCPAADRLGICIDTCHALAAGYRIDTEEGYEEFWTRMETLIGVERLRVLHLNDSAFPPGARRDRHTHIGLGYCGPDCFRWLLTDPRWDSIPMIAETPDSGDHAADRINLEVLRLLAAGHPLGVEDIRHLWRQHHGTF